MRLVPKRAHSQVGLGNRLEHGSVGAHVLQRLGDAALGRRQPVRSKERLDLIGLFGCTEAADGGYDHGGHQGGGGLREHRLDQIKVLRNRKKDE